MGFRRFCFCVVLTACSAEAQTGPHNLNFEQGAPGEFPPGWRLPTPGYTARTTDRCAGAGSKCAVIRYEGTGQPAAFGNLMQSFDGAAYRNKRVRYRAKVRVEGPFGPRAQLWLRVDRPNSAMGLFDNMQDRPITSTEWRTYDIEGDVEEDAARINIGVMLFGAGSVWIDDAEIHVLGDAERLPIEPPRALTARGRANVIAFAKLYGYVRYFHPSDEAARADWERMVVEGVRQVEGSANAAALARALEEWAHPVAPSVHVYEATTKEPPALTLSPGLAGKLVSWRHNGVGTGMPMSMYRSERVPADRPSATVEDLGAGVAVAVPLAMYSQGATPAPAAKRRYTANDRATRLAAVVIAWNILQHFYPYFEVVGTDWGKTLETTLGAAAIDKDEVAFQATLERMIAALRDGHGSVTGRSFPAPPPIGWDWIEGRLVVTHVPDAQGQPIAPGDAVLAIDGRPVAQALAEVEARISGATPQWIRSSAMRRLGSGSGELTLEIEPYAQRGARRTVRLKRGPAPTGPGEPRPEKVAELSPGLWYVDLTRLTDADWKEAVGKLEKASGIIFDMRGYPRLRPQFLEHLSEKALTSAQWHVPLVTRPDRKEMQFTRGNEWNLQPLKPYLKAKRAFLTDGRAISYAESCMGIVEHYKLAEIVGGPTAGTNGNINQFALPGGYSVVFTGMKVLKHDGSRHHGVGILPTVPASRTRAGVAAGKDEVLERALALMP